MVLKTDSSSTNNIRCLPSGTRIFHVLDVQQLSANQPGLAVKQFILKGKPKVYHCDVLVAGGGMGGVAAAIRAAQSGAMVCLTEESDWLGGQTTSQGVSALDENHFVEISGATRMYQSFRHSVRNYYRQHPGIAPHVATDDRLNPGDCWVSWLSFEPQIGHDKLTLLLQESTDKRLLKILSRTKVVDLNVTRGRVTSALVVNLDSGLFTEIRPTYCLDATELGDLLPLAGVPYASGAESRAETGEPHAPEKANNNNVQDFTYPFVVEYRPGSDNTGVKPLYFERFLSEGKFTLAGYKIFDRADGPSSQFEPFWTYRRLIAADNFPDSPYKYDLSMINWESNDLRGQNIIDQPAEQQAERLAMAKNLSLGFLYWLQTEAPRDDGGKGYPEFFLRTDILGTSDGLAKYPYIRESRRIKARHIIIEQDIAAATNPGARSRVSNDSVGIGLYPIDIHGEQDVPGAAQASRPFQLPLGSLVQSTVRNLIPACKNIGTTHITNGAYRLHPIEWAIGEAAGTLAGYCLKEQTTPQKVLGNKRRTRDVQKLLLQNGAPIFWYSDVPTIHAAFAAIQFLAITKIMPGDDDDLSFRPDAKITHKEASDVLDRLMDLIPATGSPKRTSTEQQRSPNHALLTKDQTNTDDTPLKLSAVDNTALESLFGKKLESSHDTLSRAEFALWAYKIASAKRFLGKV